MAALKYKDDHNKIAYLGRERGCEDFTDILTTAMVASNAAGSHDLVATIDGREVVVTQSSHRIKLQLKMPMAFLTCPLMIFLRGQPIPLTTPMLAIAAAAAGDDAADEDNAAANEAAGNAAEAHLVPHSPSVSLVREPTPERQPVSERPPSLSPTIPETEWVVPNPVSPVTDWRPWPYVPIHSPIRDPTPEPESPPTPPAQTFIFEEPLVFGPKPRPAGYVDPDVIEPIIFGPQPRPRGYVDPDFVEPIFFGPQPRPDNYLEPEDLDNILSTEDDTTHGGFHMESPVRPDDAPTPTADAAGRARDPALLTGFICQSFDRCYGKVGEKRLISGETRFGELNLASAADGVVDIQMILTSMIIPYGFYALGHDQPPVVVPSEFYHSPLRSFKANLYAWLFFLTIAVPENLLVSSVAVDKEMKRFEEEQASKRLVQRLRAEDLAQEDLPNVSEERAKELDDLMIRMTETDWLTLMKQVCSNPALARELLGADVNETNFIERMNAVKEKKKRAMADLCYRALKGKPMKKSEVTQMMRNLVKNQWCAAHNGTITMKDVKAMNKQQLIEEYKQRVERVSSRPTSVPAATTLPADDPDSAGGGSSNPAGSATPMAGSAASNTASGAFGVTVTDSTITTTADMDSAGSHHKIGVSPFADSAAGLSPFLSSIAGGPSPSNVSTDQIPIAVLFESILGDLNEFFLKSDEEEQIGMSRVVVDPDSDDECCCEMILGLFQFFEENRLVKSTFTYLKELLAHVYHEESPSLRSRMNRLWRTQDAWIVSSWKLYPKSSVHVLDLNQWEDCVYVCGQVLSYRQHCLNLLALHDNWFFSSPWLTAKKESGSPLQTALLVQEGMALELASPEQTATGKDMLNPLYGCDGLPKTVRVFQFTLDSRSEKLDWFLLHQDWKLLFFDVATSFDSAVHRVHAVSFDAAVLDVAATVSAACIIAAGYIVSAGICDAAGSFRYSFLLEDLEAVPADYVPAAYAKIPKLYRAYELCDKNKQLHVFDSEETLEDAEKSQLKMNELKIQPIDYGKLNKLYDNFVPQKDISAEQTYFPSSCISSEKVSSETKPSMASVPSANPMLVDLNEIENVFKKLFELLEKNYKRASIFYTSPEELRLIDVENDLDETLKQNELLKDRPLEASLAEDVKNLVITSCVEIRNKDLHDEIERISKESKDVSNESKTADTVCNDAFEVTQELSKRIVELEKDLSKFEAKSIAFEVALQHKSGEDNSLKTLQKENENFMASLQIKNAHLKQTYKDLFESESGENICDNAKCEFQTKFVELEKVLTQQTKDFDDVKLELSNRTAKFEAYFEKLEKTKVVLERQLARTVDDSKAEKD
ncbi:hypothetical protein Tco_1539590 [Tanacetum coccineum]